MTLSYTNKETVKRDVTKEFVKKEADGEILLAFPTDKNVDGIYELHYQFADKANHITENNYRFTVNRNGSVYEYDHSLQAALNQYFKSPLVDFVITEYNPSPIKNSSVTITVDGVPITDPKWKVEEEQNPDGTDRWCVRRYTISSENFTADGKYKVVLASEDGAENRSEGNPEIVFWRDTTPPEIQLVTGLENEIVNAKEQKIKIRAFDAIGLAAIKVIVTDNNGNETTLYDEYFPDGTSQEITVTLSEGLRQHVKILARDRAWNSVDTDAESFAPHFEFVDRITVSENFFTRWYANPWVFFGSISGGLVFAIGGLAAVLFKKRRKQKDAEN